jgi:hypothetical protein
MTHGGHRAICPPTGLEAAGVQRTWDVAGVTRRVADTSTQV